MPIYPYRCDTCNRKWDAFHSVADRENENCLECGKKAIKEIGGMAKPQIIEGYIDGLGEYVTGPAHMRRIMKAKGLEEVGPKDAMKSARKWM